MASTYLENFTKALVQSENEQTPAGSASADPDADDLALDDLELDDVAPDDEDLALIPDADPDEVVVDEEVSREPGVDPTGNDDPPAPHDQGATTQAEGAEGDKSTGGPALTIGVSPDLDLAALGRAAEAFRQNTGRYGHITPLPSDES